MTTLPKHLPGEAILISDYSSALFMLLTGLLALWGTMLNGLVPYTMDSANYIDQARSILAGNGFESRPVGINDMDVAREPDALFPPGYPLVIAAGSAVSAATVEVVALWINRLALVTLPLIVFVAFRPVVGLYGAVCLGILSGLSPGVVRFGTFALTDIFSLTLVVTSFGLTLAAWRPHCLRRALLLAFCGGLVAGFAYLVRNAHLAVLLALPLSMSVWFVVSSSMERFRTWRVGLSWLLGASVLVLPWITRNVIVFGKIQPYEMPPSTISGWMNLRDFISAQITEVFGYSYLGGFVGWGGIPGLLALLLIIFVFLRLCLNHWSKLQSEERRALILSLVYVGIGSAVVIAARTKYQWGEGISIRHTLQYAPFVMLSTAILLRHLSWSRRRFIAVTVTLMMVLITLRFLSIASDLDQEQQTRKSVFKLISESRLEKTGPCASENGYSYISNYAFLYRILCDANARQIEMGGITEQSIAGFTSLIESRVGHRPLIVSFHPGRGIESSNLPLSDSNVEALKAHNWVIFENSPLTLELARDIPLGAL